ncbi:MAG TPA: TolC family protein [Holophagaceae bacterium]|nr:TolC family protein [Holophagaceae bacterium]
MLPQAPPPTPLPAPPALTSPRPASQAAPTLRLSLKEALRRGLEANPRMRLAALAQARSQAEREDARAALLPTVSGFAQGNRIRQNLDPLLGMPNPGGPLVVGPFNAGAVGVQVEATLFDLSLWKRWKASRQEETATAAEAKAAREDLTALVLGQYFSAQRAQAAVLAASSQVEVAEALATLAEHQEKAGVGTGIDTLRARVQLQTERQRLIQAKAQLRIASFGLGRLLALDPGTEVEVTDPLATPAIPTEDFPAAFGRAAKDRPEAAALAAKAQAAASNLTAAKAVRLPSIVATGSYGATGLENQPWPHIYSVGVGVRVPIFTGGHVSSRIAQARIQEQEVQAQRRDLDDRMALEIRTAQVQLDSVQGEVEVATEAVQLAEAELLQARHRFEAGVTSNIEVIQAQDELAKARDRHLGALYRMNLARADLARATGELEAMYLNDTERNDHVR